MTSHDPRVPDIGAISQNQRFFRLGWVGAERRHDGIPHLSADYVARAGSSVRVVDVRTEEELEGVLGHLPGSEWVPLDSIEALARSAFKEEPIVLVSGRGERARKAVAAFLELGHQFVAVLEGGIVAWRRSGFETRRHRITATPLHLPEVTSSKAGHLTEADLRRHIGDPAELRWSKGTALLLNGRMSCVDGRDATAIVGTPGGDAGELALTLAALETVRGRSLREHELREILLWRFDQLGRFYLHSDVNASNATIASMRSDPRLAEAIDGIDDTLGWRAFFEGPPVAVRDIVLEHVLAEGHLGCGHLRLALAHPDDYGIRPELLQFVMRSFFHAMWQGAAEPAFHVLPGGHAESAVLRVFLQGGLPHFAAVPLISPLSHFGTQVFVVHGDVARHVRQRFVDSLQLAGVVQQSELAPIGERMDQLSDQGAARTLSALAAGLPIYDVTFTRKDTFQLRSAGHVAG